MCRASNTKDELKGNNNDIIYNLNKETVLKIYRSQSRQEAVETNGNFFE